MILYKKINDIEVSRFILKSSIFIIFFAFFLINLAYAFSYKEEYQYLDQLALEAGKDKSSNGHNFIEVYAPLKDQSIKFLEIGIDKSDSAKLWENYFKNGQLHFINITHKNNECIPLQPQYHLVNPENAEELQQFIEKVRNNFDIIIDDVVAIP